MSEQKKRKRGGERLAPTEQKPSKQKRGKQKAARTKQELIRHRLFVALTVVAGLIVALFIAYKVLVVKPNVNVDNPPVQPGVTLAPGEKDDNVHAASGRKKDFFTFLVVGRDTGGGGNTDTIMLVSYDVPNQKLNVMSIPRDTMVNIPYDIKRINAVYNYGGGGEKGIDALYTEVSQLVGFRPDFEVVVEWEGFGKLVDAIGGVYFDVPINMKYDDPTQNLHIRIQKGPQTLNGEQAMQVIRFRKNNNGTGYVTGDIGRIETQQAFMKAVIAQCLKADKIISNIGTYAQIFTDCVQTDLTVNNLAWLAQQAVFGGLDMENVNFVTMPGNYNATAWTRSYGMQSYVTPTGDELVALVNEHFNPYKGNVTIGDLDIMSVNKNGSLSSTTGKVEDSKAAKPQSNASATPKPPKVDEPEIVVTPAPSESPATSASPKPSQSPRPSGSPAPGTSPSPSPSATPSASPSPSPSVSPAETPAPTPEPAPVVTPPPETPTGPPEGIPIIE